MTTFTDNVDIVIAAVVVVDPATPSTYIVNTFDALTIAIWCQLLSLIEVALAAASMDGFISLAQNSTVLPVGPVHNTQRPVPELPLVTIPA